MNFKLVVEMDPNLFIALKPAASIALTGPGQGLQVTSHPLLGSLPPLSGKVWGILKLPCSQTPGVCCPGELGKEVLCGKNHHLILISALPLWA